MKRLNPLVSVLICSYNAEKFIESTIKSILDQSYINLEVLILDNNSKDKTVQILEKLKQIDSRIRVFKKWKNFGAYGGLNYLLGHAKGDYIAINDHDDIWHKNKLEDQVSILEQNNHYIGCGTAILNWYEEYQRGVLRTQPKNHSVAWHTSLIYRNVGLRYDISKTVGTDFYFMKNILCKGKARIINLGKPYVFRRIWGKQKNLSSYWMKEISFRDLIFTDIPFFDKISLINRKILPGALVEWLVLNIFFIGRTYFKKSLKSDPTLSAYVTLVN